MIGEKIKVAREARGFTQEFMAEQLGISQSAYSNIEREETRPTVQRVVKIAQILEMDAGELLSNEKGISLNINHGQISQNEIGYQVYNAFHEANERLYEELLKAKDKEIHLLNRLLEAYGNK